MAKSYKYVLLDFDGTICDLDVNWQELKSEIKSEFKIQKVKLLEMINWIFQNSSSIERTKLIQLIAKYEQPSGVVKYQHFYKALIELSGKIYIVSNNLTETIVQVLMRENVMNLIESVIGIDKVMKPKPDIHSFEIIQTLTLDNDASNYLFIGDSEIDEKFAANCGIDFINIRDFHGK